MMNTPRCRSFGWQRFQTAAGGTLRVVSVPTSAQSNVYWARKGTIMGKNIVVLSDVRPIRTPPTNTKEFMVPADEPIVKYREKLREWDGWGWRIDVEEVSRNTRKTAYAIPCPERRNRKGWVLDPIPVLQTDGFGDTIGRLDAKN